MTQTKVFNAAEAIAEIAARLNGVERRIDALDSVNTRTRQTLEDVPAPPRHLDGVLLDEPDGSRTHFCIGKWGDIYKGQTCGAERFAVGNCFVSEDAAKWHVERRKVIAELMRCEGAYLGWGSRSDYSPGLYSPVYFRSFIEAKQVCKKIGDRRLRYLEPWEEDKKP